MPQMMPMNWCLIFIFSLLTLHFMFSLLYFLPKNQLTTSPTKNLLEPKSMLILW